ncbi:chemotaxis protein CheW [Oscillatoria sp. CS-180]|uniref:chemotaxis protein CheW n=1 Tax=Oscillatoria sp. CS-180 TaxID=3021720 RepID=UPI00232CBCBA|nr:chemotaxis protein CheW [Oscillatoria sp. CS-180]MDB9526336.1 chemotaxis protein CheW [Oscillatoria sp. CS-180]
MSQNALVRVRRNRSHEPTLRLLAFRLRQHWFCLPLAIARRVIPRPVTPEGKAAGLIQLKDENILVLDAARLIYGVDIPQLAGETTTSPSATIAQPQEHNIVIVELPQRGSVGLLVDGTPVLKRVRQSAFSPVPAVYLTVHRLNGVSHVVNPNAQETNRSAEPMFFLSIEALLPA